jgi:putative membrane protein
MTETTTPGGAETPAPHSPAGSPEPVLKPTRTSGVWVAVIGFTALLLLLAVFLLQNGQRVQISYLGADGHLPLAVAMLLSAIAGALLVSMAGVARVLQLRHTARRERKARRS